MTFCSQASGNRRSRRRRPARRLVLLAVACATFTSPLHGQGPVPIELPAADWEAPVEFTNIVGVRELNHGALVADRGEDRLLFLAWGEVSPRSVARPGGGPGEYQGVGQLLVLSGDSTLFIDLRRRWHVLDRERIVATTGPGSSASSRLQLPLGGADRRGRVLAVNYSGRMGSAGWADSLLVLVAARDEQRIDTVFRIKGPGGTGPIRLQPIPGRAQGIVPHHPLATADRALLFPDGWIAVVRAEPYRVDWRTPGGSWTGGAALPIEQSRVDEREKCAALSRLLGENLQCDPGIIREWPAILPPFLALEEPVLFAAPSGHVIVRRTPRVTAPMNRYDVIDRFGRLTGTIRLSANEKIVGFGRRSVYLVLTGASDLQTLRRHPWPVEADASESR